MNPDLERRLEQDGIRFERLEKSRKVALLARWSRTFPALVAAARRGEQREEVVQDNEADQAYASLPAGDFYILPDDASGMLSVCCHAAMPPDLSELVSDTFTKCDELVVLDREFQWSAVFVNHGWSTVGRHFSRKASKSGDRK